MNLKYSILWFDDTADFFDSIDRTPLENEITDWGFSPEVQFVSEPEQFMAHEPFNEFDLIVVDYNLEAHEEHGSTFIRKIRDHQIFTEVVFYSSNQASDLWDAIRQNTLEGVFVANRRNVLEKVQHVAEHSVRKILDIENMRGIVMAEVGDIDRILDEISHIAIPRLSEAQSKTIYERFHGSCQTQDSQKKTRLDLFIQKPEISDMISLSDSSKRWDNFNRIRKAIPKLKEFDFGDYPKDILQPRNFLAHGIPTRSSQGEVIFSFNGTEYKFCEETGRKLRKSISAYKKQLIAAHSFLTSVVI